MQIFPIVITIVFVGIPFVWAITGIVGDLVFKK